MTPAQAAAYIAVLDAKIAEAKLAEQWWTAADLKNQRDNYRWFIRNRRKKPAPP